MDAVHLRATRHASPSSASRECSLGSSFRDTLCCMSSTSTPQPVTTAALRDAPDELVSTSEEAVFRLCSAM